MAFGWLIINTVVRNTVRIKGQVKIKAAKREIIELKERLLVMFLTFFIVKNLAINGNAG
jgi:hypothetical protein